MLADQNKSSRIPEDRGARDQATQRAIRIQGGYETEYRILLPDGKVRWIAGRGRCLLERDAKLTRLLGVSMDITERKQAQELFQVATEASPSDPVGDPIRNDSGFQQLLAWKAALKYRDNADH